MGSKERNMFGAMNINELPPIVVDPPKNTVLPTNKNKGKKKEPVYEEEYQIYRKRKTQEELDAEEEEEKRREIHQLKAAAEVHCRAGNIDKAIELYKEVLKIDTKHIECMLLRANCYFSQKNFTAAIKDADKALTIEKDNTKALGMRAESLYLNGEFEQALVSFHKAKRLRPGIRTYHQGIQRCQLAIECAIGESSGVRLTLDGDLSYFEQFVEGRYRENAAYRRATRWDKSRKSTNENNKKKKPDPKTVKQLLRELYGDYEYLEMILSEEEKQLKHIEKTEKAKQEEINNRNQENRLRGTHDSENEEDFNLRYKGSLNEKKQQRRKNTSYGIKKDVMQQLDFLHQRTEFYRQLNPSRKGQGETGERSESQLSVASVHHSDQLLQFMEEIEMDLSSGKYNLCLKRCDKALEFLRRQLYSELPNRDEFEATVFSFMGNSHFEMGDYEAALDHHKRDLEIAKKLELSDAYSRALDNLGRTYSKMGRFVQAISIFEEKLGLVKEPIEATWLHHELGRCYFEQQDYIKAFEHSEKSLSAADEADDNGWRLNATVLMAQAQEQMGNHQDAYEAYNKALKISRRQRDKLAQVALNNALKEVRQKMKEENQQIPQGEDENEDDDKDLQDQEEKDAKEAQVDEDSPEDIRRAILEGNAEAEREEEQEQEEAIRDAIRKDNAEEEEKDRQKAEDIRDTIKKSNKTTPKKLSPAKATQNTSPKTQGKQLKPEPKSKQQHQTVNKSSPGKDATKQYHGNKKLISPSKNLEKSPYKKKGKTTQKQSPKKTEEKAEEEKELNKPEQDDNIDGENEAKDIRDTIKESNEDNEVDANDPIDIRDAIKSKNQENKDENESEKDTSENKSQEHQENLNETAENDIDNPKNKATNQDETKTENEIDSSDDKTTNQDEIKTEKDIRDMIKASNEQNNDKEDDQPNKAKEKDDFFD